MINYLVIPEIDVLEATVAFLTERSVVCYSVSVAKGKGIDSSSSKGRAWRALIDGGIPPIYPFSAGGSDITGISATEWWRVECKGAGSGTQQTQRNNFDRALASAVSYYCEKAEDLPEEYLHWGSARPYLGLALPASRVYLDALKKRVRQPLRRRLNLWVLLYEPNSKRIGALSPDDNY